MHKTMKKNSLTLVALTLAATLTFITATAKNKVTDQEYRHIVITLLSGEKVDGYIHRDWSALTSYYTLKRPNYSFKIVPSPDGKGGEAVKYTADEIDWFAFVEPTEAYPDGERWEARDLSRPSIKDRYNTDRSLMCLEKRGEHASLYRWIGLFSGGHQGKQTIAAPVYGVKFDFSDTVYPIYTDQANAYIGSLVILLKKEQPELSAYINEYFKKGPDSKAHRKQLKEDPSLILRAYEEFVAGQR